MDRVRAFPVRLPSGVRYWTVMDADLRVVPVADSFLRQVRFGRDGAESRTKSYACSIALFFARWAAGPRAGPGTPLRSAMTACLPQQEMLQPDDGDRPAGDLLDRGHNRAFGRAVGIDQLA